MPTGRRTWTSEPVRFSRVCGGTWRRRPTPLRAGFVGEVGAQPALDLGEVQSAPPGVLLGLVASDAPHGEVARRRMREEQTADAGGNFEVPVSDFGFVGKLRYASAE